MTRFDAKDWLQVKRGETPLIVSTPHTGIEIPPDIEGKLVSPWLARKDADWRVDQLYGFAAELGATMVSTRLSRTVIDVNRDPSGASLYPGQATTELCPSSTFDGEPLYRDRPPGEAEIDRRREQFFAPYHRALQAEIDRLRERLGAVVLYEAHSIRSVIPRLFEGTLPHVNIGTNGGGSCAGPLAASVEAIFAKSAFSRAVNGRFKGGWTTRAYGRPRESVHAIQVELAMRSYLDEPLGPLSTANWPPAFDPARAGAMRDTLREVFLACIAFAKGVPA